MITSHQKNTVTIFVWIILVLHWSWNLFYSRFVWLTTILSNIQLLDLGGNYYTTPFFWTCHFLKWSYVTFGSTVSHGTSTVALKRVSIYYLISASHVSTSVFYWVSRSHFSRHSNLKLCCLTLSLSILVLYHMVWLKEVIKMIVIQLCRQ